MGKGDELPREHGHRGHWGWEHLFCGHPVSRKMEQFPSPAVPKHWHAWLYGRPLPCQATSQQPAEGKAPALALLCFAEVLPVELLAAAVSTFLRKANKQRWFP